MKPCHLSLFSGSGIGDYIAELAGFETVGLCECEPDCLYALRKLYPNAKVFDDVTLILEAEEEEEDGWEIEEID